MAESKAQRLDKVHARAMERFDRCYASQRDVRLQCVRDRRFAFVPGAQYEGDLEQQFENRPRFEINKVQLAIVKIFSEYRNNRVTVDFRPADNDTNEDTADFLDGLYRADEQDSGAQEAYDTAFEEGVAGGVGAWRLTNRYDDEEDEDANEDEDRRRICIESIPDADNSVFFDIDAKRYDKRDASYCFVISGMQQPEYEDMSGEDATAATNEWNGKRKAYKARNITSFDKVSRMGAYDWFAPDVIYVAEYYDVETVTQPVNFYRQRASGEEQKLKPKDYAKKEDFEKAEAALLAQGFFMARVKKITTRRVHKYIIDGNQVLEDCGYVGRNIPVVPFYAKRLFIDNIERVQGHLRTAIDAQRLYNMIISMLAELTTYSWVEKPILTPAQILGHEEYWALDPIKRYPYLLINPDIGPNGEQLPASPLNYTKAPSIPPALAGLLQMIGMDLQEVLGQSSNSEELVSNISAKAVELIQNRLDMQNFIYMDNFKKSMRRCGEIWLDMARDNYDEEDRPMRVVNEDGTDDIVNLRQKTVDGEGAETYKYDPAAGKFKVIADVGPSFTTRRDGTVRAITGMLQFVEDPQDRSVLTAIAVKNLEGEGLEPAKQYYRRKMLALGLEKPSEEEQAEMDEAEANQQPSAQDQFLLAEAQKSLALADKAKADAGKSAAEAAETLANIQKIAQEIKTADLDRLLKVIEAHRNEDPATTA